MKRRLVLLTCCLIVLVNFSHSQAQDTSIPSRLIGKWTQHYTGMSLHSICRPRRSLGPIDDRFVKHFARLADPSSRSVPGEAA